MSSAETGREGRKRRRSKKLRRDCDADVDQYSNIKEAFSGVMIMIREQAEKDWEKKRDETMKRVASEVRSPLDNVESKLEEERHKFVEAMMKHFEAYNNAQITELGKSLKELQDDTSSTFFKCLRSALDSC